MSDVNIDTVRYSRTAPPEWDSLVDFATAQLATGKESSGVTAAHAEAIFAEIDEKLDNEQLDANRYYGLGLVMCGLARALQQPETRQSTVEWAARNLADFFLGPGLRPGDLDSLSMNYPFKPLAQQSSNTLPVATRTVADTLVAIGMARQFNVKHPDISLGKDSDDFRFKEIAKGKYAAEVVGGAATSAATIIIRRALRAQSDPSAYAVPADSPEGTSPDEPVIGEGMLHQLDLRRVAINCARLRIDEFADMDNLIDIGPTGELIFVRERVPKILAPPVNQPPPERRAVLHTKRLGCPALYVQGLIPLMLDIVPEIIMTAQEKIARNHAVRIALYG